MSDNNTIEKFQRWYKEPLESLYSNEHAGFAILTLGLPLLERYLRQKGRIFTTSLTPVFYTELVKLFPALGDGSVPRCAEHFWNSYRNGLLHQTTLQLSSSDEVYVKNDLPEPVKVEASGRRFAVCPVRFAMTIIQAIESDFKTFEGAGTKAPPLSSVANTVGASGVSRGPK